MSSSFDKFQRRRLISAYFSVIISVFLVLFLLGLLGIFIINSKKLANDFKENIAMTVFFKNEANDSVIKAFGNELKNMKFAKSYQFVSKDAAAKQHTDVIGEDFVSFLGENPLQNSYDIHLKADFVFGSSFLKIERQFKQNPAISDVFYDKQLVDLVNDNIEKVSMWILIVSGFFTIIAILLINSSLRLSIYSNRFIIKTMQMVGATKAFIRKPFIVQSVKLGVAGAIMAIIALCSVLWYLETNFPSLGILSDQLAIALILIGVLFAGIFITWGSTYFATQKFLNLKTEDDLY
jgi:cell division transport system permease protein